MNQFGFVQICYSLTIDIVIFFFKSIKNYIMALEKKFSRKKKEKVEYSIGTNWCQG